MLMAIWQPRWLVWGIVTYTVFEETALRWLPSLARYAGEVVILFLLVEVIAKQVLTSGKLHYRRTPLELPLIIFVLIGLTSAWLNRVPLVIAILGLRLWLRYVILFYVVTLLDWPAQSQERFLLGLVVIAVVEAGLGLLQAAGGRTIAQWFAAPDVELGGQVIQQIQAELVGAKISGTLGRYDRFGNYLMLMLLLAIALLPSLPSKGRGRLSAGIVIIAAALLLSFSRQAWLGVAAGLAAIAVLEKRSYITLMTLALLAIVLIILLVGEIPTSSTAGGNPATVITRLLEPFSPYYWQALYSVGGRMYYIFVIGPKLLQTSPWLGLGPGRFASLVTRLYPTPVYQDLDIPQRFADNFASDIQWMAILGQVGLLGLIAFVWMLVRLTRLAYRQFRQSARRTLCREIALTFLIWSIAVVLISCLGPNLEVRIVTLNYWILAGFVCVNSCQAKQQLTAEQEQDE